MQAAERIQPCQKWPSKISAWMFMQHVSSTGEQHRISRHRHFADFAPGIQVLLHGDNGNPAAQRLEVEHMRRAHVAAAAPRVVQVIKQVPLGYSTRGRRAISSVQLSYDARWRILYRRLLLVSMRIWNPQLCSQTQC